MATDPVIPAGALSLHTSSSEDDAAVVRCSGRLTGETSLVLKEEVKPLLLVKRRVILDLTELGYMDSAGLGALVGLYISAKKAGCELQLVNLTPRIRDLLGMSHLLSVFEACGRHGTRF
jgi:anti-sigma B factor antagonist